MEGNWKRTKLSRMLAVFLSVALTCQNALPVLAEESVWTDTAVAAQDDTNAYLSAEVSEVLKISLAKVTVAAGTYVVSKVHDGTAAAGTGTGELSVSGILAADSSVTVIATPGDYESAEVQSVTGTVSLALDGDTVRLPAVKRAFPPKVLRPR